MPVVVGIGILMGYDVDDALTMGFTAYCRGYGSALNQAPEGVHKKKL